MMGVALRGNLEDFGIAEVFQLIGQQQKTGLLDVTGDARTLRLAFDAGRVVWARPVGLTEDAVVGERMVRCGMLTQAKLDAFRAQSGVSARSVSALAIDSGEVSAADVALIEELITNETLFTVLRWSAGSFDFSARPVAHDVPPEKLLGAEQILMDGLRMVDEWQTFAALVPTNDVVFERCGQLDEYRKKAGPESQQRLARVEKVFSLVDGRLPVQRIIDLSRLGLFDATRALAELHRNELIRPLSGVQAKVRRRLVEPPKPAVIERSRWLLAAAFPLALLSLVVSMILDGAPASEGPAVFPIQRAPLESARAVFEKRQLRHALEAQHLLSGRWPETLSESDQTELLGRSQLAPEGDEVYYYARRGNGIVLLTPER